MGKTQKDSREISRIADYLMLLGPMYDGGSQSYRKEIAEWWYEDIGTLDKCMPWLDAGYWASKAAFSVLSAGYGPTDIPKSKDDRLDIDPIDALCNGDIDIEDLIWT